MLPKMYHHQPPTAWVVGYHQSRSYRSNRTGVVEQGKIGGNLEKEKPQQLSYCRVSVRLSEALSGAKFINHTKKNKKKKRWERSRDDLLLSAH
jgi:hypothetical protein